jgi:hypothetical protein
MLSKLPAPKNDYEIVLPEDATVDDEKSKKKSKYEENDELEHENTDLVGEQYEILDEAEVQARRKLQLKAKCDNFFKN